MKFQEHLNILSKIRFPYKTQICKMFFYLFNDHYEEIKALGLDASIQQVCLHPIIEPLRRKQ